MATMLPYEEMVLGRTNRGKRTHRALLPIEMEQGIADSSLPFSCWISELNLDPKRCLRLPECLQPCELGIGGALTSPNRVLGLIGVDE